MKELKDLIKFRPELFWDVDVSTLDHDMDAVYIIERILDFGRDDEVRWMNSYYSRDLLRRITDTSRVLHDKSRVFWQLVYQ